MEREALEFESLQEERKNAGIDFVLPRLAALLRRLCRLSDIRTLITLCVLSRKFHSLDFVACFVGKNTRVS